RSYHLEIVQHPIKTAEFGNSTLSRLPLAPPLIAQLHIRGHAAVDIPDESELPFLVAQLSLYSADGTTPVDLSADGAHASPERMLYGSLVSSPHILKNLQGRQGVYFLFPDVSIRWRGRFQLSVTLIKLGQTYGRVMLPCRMPPNVAIGESGIVLDRVKSHAFDVHARNDYVAPAQTPLTQYFLQQGARMYAFASSAQFMSGSR
ncbi:velvet factor, partial [Cristinia sonorae]